MQSIDNKYLINLGNEAYESSLSLKASLLSRCSDCTNLEELPNDKYICIKMVGTPHEKLDNIHQTKRLIFCIEFEKKF